MLDVTVYDGKYTVKMDNQGCLTALRYGEPWRDCCGDGLILALAQEVESLREQLSKLEPIRMKFDDMPYGTRFKYPQSDSIWVVIQKYRKRTNTEPMHGTIARWDDVPTDHQSLCLHDPNEEGLPEDYEVVDHF